LLGGSFPFVAAAFSLLQGAVAAVCAGVGLTPMCHSLIPGEVLRIEGTVGLPDREDEVQEFTHAMADGDVAAFALGPEPAIQRADGGVAGDGGAGGVPEIVADQVIAFCDMRRVPAGKGRPCLSTPEVFSSGKAPK